MKFIFKFFVAFAILFESYRVLGLSENWKLQDTCQHPSPMKSNESYTNVWQKGVIELHDGCENVLKRFTGPTFDIGETLIRSFERYADGLTSFTNSNSTLLSTRCTSTLETLSLLNKLGRSPTYLLYQFGKAMPKVSTAFRNIVTNLSASIGKLVGPVNDAITLTENSIVRILTQFQNRFVEHRQDRSAKIDFEEVIENVQLFTNTVALIAETALNDCGCVTFANEAYEAISSLIFILNLYLIGAQGTNVIIASVLLSESTEISAFLNSSFQAIDPLVGGVAKAISAITFDIAKSMREFLTYFVHATYTLNNALEEIVGPFQGTKVNVAQIKMNLVKSQGN